MEFNEEDFLMLSGIQHFAFCRRQWALIHIEQEWSENLRTAEGQILHENAHDPYFSESRKEVRIVRAMPVFSRTLGLSGECDIVEFVRADKGITLKNAEGLYSVMPVEYKRGTPKEDECDVLQVAAQAICLEEMLLCEVNRGCIYYAQTRRRLYFEITPELKERVRAMATEMHVIFRKGRLPEVRRTKSCNACSLKDICLPSLSAARSAKSYTESVILGDE